MTARGQPRQSWPQAVAPWPLRTAGGGPPCWGALTTMMGLKSLTRIFMDLLDKHGRQCP